MTRPAPSFAHRLAAVLAVLAAAALSAAVVSGQPASAATSPGLSPAAAWAPTATAQIHPGTMMYTDGAQCTGNFVFTDTAGNTYLGYAAHCAGTGSSTDTNGCQTDSVPLGTRVDLTN